MGTYTNKFGSTGTAVSEFHYFYDAWGNIAGIVDLNGRERYYEYNDNNEVVYAKEAYTDGTEREYTELHFNVFDIANWYFDYVEGF